MWHLCDDHLTTDIDKQDGVGATIQDMSFHVSNIWIKNIVLGEQTCKH